MNMEKFTLQSSLEANYLNIVLEEPVLLDGTAIRVIQQDCPEFLIPFRITSMNNSVMLKYKLLNTVAIEYANMTLPKSSFLRLYKNLLIPFVKGSDWFLDYHHFCVDAKYVFLERETGKVFFIYVPEASYSQTDGEILDFFKKVFTNTTITDDKEFQVTLFKYFSGNAITLTGLYQILTAEEGKGMPAAKAVQSRPVETFSGFGGQPGVSGQTGRKPEEAMASGQPADTGKRPQEDAGKAQKDAMKSLDSFVKPLKEAVKPAKEVPPVPETKPATEDLFDSDDEVMKALFGEKKKGKSESPKAAKKQGMFQNLFASSHKKDVPKEAKSLVPPEPVSARKTPETPKAAPKADPFRYGYVEAPAAPVYEKTEIAGDDFLFGHAAYLELIQSPLSGAMPKISLGFDAPYITIGRLSTDEVKPDVAFPSSFKKISRQHARIQKEGDTYFIIDLGSLNRTYINGQALVPNQPYPLTDGAELTFSEANPVKYRVHL